MFVLNPVTLTVGTATHIDLTQNQLVSPAQSLDGLELLAVKITNESPYALLVTGPGISQFNWLPPWTEDIYYPSGAAITAISLLPQNVPGGSFSVTDIQSSAALISVYLQSDGRPLGQWPAALTRQVVAANLLNTDVNTGNTVSTLGSVLTTLESVLTNTGNSVTNLASVITNLQSLITNTGSIITNTGSIITNTGGIITNTSGIVTNTGNIATLAGQSATYVSISNLVLNTTFTLTLPGVANKTTYLMGFHLTSTALSNGTDYYEIVLAGLAGVGSDQFTVTANATQGAQLIMSYTPFGIPANGQNTDITIQCTHAAANASWYTIGAYGYQI